MQTVFITGANKSIGFETARQLAQKGYFVYIGSREAEKGREAVATLKAEGLNNADTIRIDVSDPGSIDAARKELGAKIGGTGALDILINNAGISGGMPQDPLTFDVDSIRAVFGTNLFGTIRVIQTFIDLLKKSEAPRIVNVTSGLASLTLQDDPTWKYYNFRSAAYGPSKTALNAYTVSLAFALRNTPFKVNAVDPGFTATDFNQHRGTRQVGEAAAHIVKYAILDADGPTGKFFSDDNNPETGISPW